jgi:beta-phosphoglucomutase family hydrolase
VSDPVLASGLGLIFDMDGVLLDSNPTHREVWAAFNRRYGLETTDEMHSRMYGRRNDQIVRDFFGQELADDEVTARGLEKEALYRETVADRLEGMLVPGLREFLERHRSVPMAVASNAEPANIDLLLDRADLRKYFHAVVNGTMVEHPKPHPEIYLRAAESLATAPGNCIVFEDSFAGVEAARLAGMRIVGVSTTHEDLPGTGITIDNFRNKELHQWLTRQQPV